MQPKTDAYLKICFPKHIITKQPQILNYGCKKRMRIYYAIISVPSRNVTLISLFLPTVMKSTMLPQAGLKRYDESIGPASENAL